jgi:hypothetical protein
MVLRARGGARLFSLFPRRFLAGILECAPQGLAQVTRKRSRRQCEFNSQKGTDVAILREAADALLVQDSRKRVTHLAEQAGICAYTSLLDSLALLQKGGHTIQYCLHRLVERRTCFSEPAPPIDKVVQNKGERPPKLLFAKILDQRAER